MFKRLRDQFKSDEDCWDHVYRTLIKKRQVWRVPKIEEANQMNRETLINVLYFCPESDYYYESQAVMRKMSESQSTPDLLSKVKELVMRASPDSVRLYPQVELDEDDSQSQSVSVSVEVALPLAGKQPSMTGNENVDKGSNESYILSEDGSQEEDQREEANHEDEEEKQEQLPVSQDLEQKQKHASIQDIAMINLRNQLARL